MDNGNQMKKKSCKSSKPCIWSLSEPGLDLRCKTGFQCHRCEWHNEKVRAILRMNGDYSRVNGGIEAPLDRFYHLTNTWIRPVENGSFRVGLNRFASFLIGRVFSIVFPLLKSSVQKNRPGIWLSSSEGLIGVRLPISGSILRVNSHLKAYPGHATLDPYEKGWLMDISPDTESFKKNSLMSGASVSEYLKGQWSHFNQRANQLIHTGNQELQTTMADGGLTENRLREMIGSAKYRNLIMEFL